MRTIINEAMLTCQPSKTPDDRKWGTDEVKQDSGIITARQAHGLLTLAIGAALFYSSGSFARPDLQPLGPNIADKGSAFYHFTQRQYDSADGERHYRVWTAVPDKAPPAPVIRYCICWTATR